MKLVNSTKNLHKLGGQSNKTRRMVPSHNKSIIAAIPTLSVTSALQPRASTKLRLSLRNYRHSGSMPVFQLQLSDCCGYVVSDPMHFKLLPFNGY